MPVVEEEDGSLTGVDAVIDKDLAAMELAVEMHADVLMILTEVEAVSLHFGTPEQRPLARATPAELEEYARQGHFPPGSMLPKVQAAMSFATTGGEAIIASLEKAAAALKGESGTRVVR